MPKGGKPYSKSDKAARQRARKIKRIGFEPTAKQKAQHTAKRKGQGGR